MGSTCTQYCIQVRATCRSHGVSRIWPSYSGGTVPHTNPSYSGYILYIRNRSSFFFLSTHDMRNTRVSWHLDVARCTTRALVQNSALQRPLRVYPPFFYDNYANFPGGILFTRTWIRASTYPDRNFSTCGAGDIVLQIGAETFRNFHWYVWTKCLTVEIFLRINIKWFTQRSVNGASQCNLHSYRFMRKVDFTSFYVSPQNRHITRQLHKLRKK